MSEDRTESFLRGAFFGVMVGLTIGILFAPRSGYETREILKEKGKEISEKTREVVEETKSKGREFIAGKGIDIEEEK